MKSFTGRDELLFTIRRQLTRERTTALTPTTALYGLGGVGKTQLALAYADKYRDNYQLGWWIPADSELSITTSFAELAVALGMCTELPVRELANSAREMLAKRAGWLLIFDNATRPNVVANYLPATGKGHVLLTSRSLDWEGIADQLPVDVLSLDDAVELLRRRSRDSDRQAAEALAVELGRLALALEQAAAYAGQYHTTYQRPLARYLALFRERQAELLAEGAPLAYSGTVDATYTLAVDQLRDSNPAAVQLLEICALLATDEIPIHLLFSRPEHLPTLAARAARDSMARDKMVSALIEAGLLTPDRTQTGVVRTHRIIQMVTVAHFSTYLSKPERRQRVEQTLDLLAALFPEEGWLPDRQPRCAQLLPHAQHILEHAADQQLTTPAVAELLLKVGRYLWGSRLALHQARDMHRQALAINRRRHQGDHPNVARSLNELGADLRRLGQLEEALALDTEALEMRRRLHRRDHPEVAQSLGSLAADLRRLGEAEQARDLDTQALNMHRRLYHGDHASLARSLFGLAMDLRATDEVGRARELDTEALEMRRRLYNGDHPAIAYSLGNVAVDLYVLREEEDLDLARALDTEALQMRQRLYHSDHPDIATNLTNLGNAFYLLEDFNRALDLDNRALEMRQRLYQGDHPAIAESLYNLAADMRGMGRANRARELVAEASAMEQRLANAILAGGELADVALFVLWTGRRVRAFDD